MSRFAGCNLRCCARLLTAGLIPLLTGTVAHAANGNVSTGSGIEIQLHGFVSASLFYQDQNFFFGNGQPAVFPQPPSVSGENNGLSGGDVRNTLAYFAIHGPRLDNGWRADAHIEFDFFGGFNGSGPFSGQQPIPRLRMAYVELTNPQVGGTLVIGQNWDLLFPISDYDHIFNLPPSYTHLIFPLGFGTGLIGWRYPGVTYSQNLGKLARRLDGARFTIGVFEGNYDGPGNNVNFGTAGSVNFHPQWEGRLSYHRKNWNVYLTGIYSSEKLTGVGGTSPPVNGRYSLSTYALALGGTAKADPFSAGFGVYVGRGLGTEFAALTQFGDIRSAGGYLWGQYQLIGLGLKHWSLAGSYAIDKPNSGDVLTWVGDHGRVRNQQFAADLLYSNGPYGLGVEWLHAVLRTWASSRVDQQTTVGNQYSISAFYQF